MSCQHWKEHSRYTETITSPAGANGCMQFMYLTFQAYGEDGDRDGVKDINNCLDSMASASNYMTKLVDSYGNIEQALKAYNGGPKCAFGGCWESDDYSDKILECANNLIF